MGVKRNAHPVIKAILTALWVPWPCARVESTGVVKTTWIPPISRFRTTPGGTGRGKSTEARAIAALTLRQRSPRARTRPRFWFCLRNTHPSACTRLQDQTPRHTSPPRPLLPGPAAAGGARPGPPRRSHAASAQVSGTPNHPSHAQASPQRTAGSSRAATQRAARASSPRLVASARRRESCAAVASRASEDNSRPPQTTRWRTRPTARRASLRDGSTLQKPQGSSLHGARPSVFHRHPYRSCTAGLRGIWSLPDDEAFPYRQISWPAGSSSSAGRQTMVHGLRPRA